MGTTDAASVQAGAGLGDGRYYCEDNGVFCAFMDRSGVCVATSCKQMIRTLIRKNGGLKDDKDSL